MRRALEQQRCCDGAVHNMNCAASCTTRTALSAEPLQLESAWAPRRGLQQAQRLRGDNMPATKQSREQVSQPAPPRPRRCRPRCCLRIAKYGAAHIWARVSNRPCRRPQQG